MSTPHWISIESRRHLALADQELVLQLVDDIEQARQLATRLPAILHVMRDYMGGQPQGSGRGGDGPAPWCWAHERTTVECDREGLVCSGELLSGPSDPTGNAAVTGDRASADYRQLRRDADQLRLLVGRLLKMAAPYPVELMVEEFVEPSPGEDWCRSCWRDDKHCQPISRKANGHPYYAGLCKWCGAFEAEHNTLPPLPLLQRRHRGDRIYPAAVAQALKDEVARRAVEKAKGKPKMKNRRATAGST